MARLTWGKHAATVVQQELELKLDSSSSMFVSLPRHARSAAILRYSQHESTSDCSPTTLNAVMQAKFVDVEKMATGLDNTVDVDRLCAADSLFDSEFGKRIRAADRDGGKPVFCTVINTPGILAAIVHPSSPNTVQPCSKQ